MANVMIAGTMPGSKERAFIDEVIARQTGHPGALLRILEEVQERHAHKYLSLPTIEYIARRTDTPLSQIFSVVTFYAFFNREPQGEHTISICRGTACHTRGSRNLLETVRLELGLHENDDSHADKLTLTTPDGKFTIRTVACFGQCALAPIVEIDHRICGHMNERVLARELETLVHGASR
jgi:NADH-quinone oxidoreductase subunit E